MSVLLYVGVFFCDSKFRRKVTYYEYRNQPGRTSSQLYISYPINISIFFETEYYSIFFSVLLNGLLLKIMDFLACFILVVMETVSATLTILISVDLNPIQNQVNYE